METAGKALSEAELRAYIKCSQLHHYGGKEEPAIQTKLTQHTVEYWMAQSLRTPHKKTQFLLTKAVASASAAARLDRDYLAGQAEGFRNKTFLWMDEFLKLFSPDRYHPVQGPMPWRVKVSRSYIDLLFSGVFRTAKNKTLHLLSFTPYKDRHSQVNDPITHLKLHALKEHVRNDPRRPRAVLHLLWAREDGTLGYTSVSSEELNPKYMKMIKAKMQEMERGTHFPVLPCRYACPFKKKCFPGEAQ